MRLAAVLIEAFAAGPCQGNGAAVVRLDRPLAAPALQAIAASLRQSETAFLLKQPQGWLLRWFTPSCEVRLCGHATLAALLALAHWGELRPGDGLSFHSRSGPLPVTLAADPDGGGAIVLPAGPLTPAAPDPALAQLLARRSGQPIVSYWTSALGYGVALLPRGNALQGLDGLAAELQGAARDGLVVMAEAAAAATAPRVMATPADYQLRFFAPGLGIPEDAVTGSAHALVAPFWLQHTGRPSVVGWQPSMRPGGMVCSRASSGMIRLLGTGHLLWDGILHFGHCGSGAGGVFAADDPAGWAALRAAV